MRLWTPPRTGRAARADSVAALTRRLSCRPQRAGPERAGGQMGRSLCVGALKFVAALRILGATEQRGVVTDA